MRLRSKIFALSLSGFFLILSGVARAQCPGNNCPQTPDATQYTPPGPSPCPKSADYGNWGIPLAIQVGQYNKYVYGYGQWGPGRFSLADPANPIFASYIPMENLCTGPVPVGGDGFQAGDRMAVAEAPDGSAVTFVNWKLAGGGGPTYAVSFPASGKPTVLFPAITYDVGTGQMAGQWVSGHYYGYIPYKDSGGRHIAVIDATGSTPALAGTIEWPVSSVRARTLSLPVSDSHYLIAPTGSSVYVGLLGANGLPTQQNVTSVSPNVAGEADMAVVNGTLYVFVNGTYWDGSKSVPGISVYQVNADLSLTPLFGGLGIPDPGDSPPAVGRMTVSGGPFPAILALNGANLRVFGTKFLATASCLPAGPDIVYNTPTGAPGIGAGIVDGLTLPANAGFVAYRFSSPDATYCPPCATATGQSLQTDFFKATCIVGDTTSPPTAGIKVTNSSAHYASDPTNYFGDTFNILDQSSSGAPLQGVNFDLDYLNSTFDKDVTIMSTPFSLNAYLPCDLANDGPGGTGCWASVGSPPATVKVADQSWNKNNPNGQPPSNTATQSISFQMPKANVANYDTGTNTVQVLTGGNLDASPSTGTPQAYCWKWNQTAPTNFSLCDASVVSPTVPANTTSFGLLVGYYPDKALTSQISGAVQQVDVLPSLTWSPTQPVRSNGGSSTFTVTATRQKGPSITIASVNIWIDKNPLQGASVPTSPCGGSQSAPCYLLQQSDLNGAASVVAPNDLSTTLYIHARYGYSGGSGSSVETVPQQIQFIDYQPTPSINITGSGVSVNPFTTPHWHIAQNTSAQFTDGTAADQGHITTAFWDFGDGSNGIQINGDATTTPANYTYTATGTHTISFCVNNASAPPGCTTDQVSVDPPTPFHVSASASPNSVQPNQTVSFSVSVSGGNGGSISTCDWNFGDGSAHSSSCSATHKYSSASTYSASVAVTTTGGDSGTGYATVSVSSGGGGGDCNLYPWLPGCGGGGGSFSISVSGSTYGLPGQNLNFIASASNETGSVTYNWDFGDGGTATGSNVSHAWATSNNYTISVTAQDGGGHTASTSLQVAISSSGCPPGSFLCQSLKSTATITGSGSGNLNSWTLTAGNSITFTADETSTSTNYDWKFSDDGSEMSGTDQQTVTHYYPNASPAGSPFTVTLTVTNGGATATGTMSITVQPRPYSALLVLGAGHLDDSIHGYTWKTNLSLFNPTGNPMNIYLDYEKRDPYNWQNGDPSKLPYSVGPAFTIYPKQGIRLSDVVNNSNVTSANAGDPGQRGDVGFLYVQYTGSAPPQAMASIYAERASDGATFGSALPIIPVANGGNGISSISLTQARLVGLKNGPSYRSILYVFNPSSQQAEYNVTVYRSDGTTLAGYPQTITVQPFEWQADSLSSSAWGAPDDSQTYFAKIVPTNANSNAPVFAQASVVDNVSGDSVVISDNTTSPIGIPNGQQFTYYVPGAGRIDSNGHHWRTDLWMYNPGSIDQHILVTYRYTRSDGTEVSISPPNGNPTVPAHGQLSLTDVIGQLLGSTDNTQGTLMITFSGGNSPADNAIAIAGRVYDDQGSAGTVGTQLQAFLAPNGDELPGGSSKSLVLTGLVADASGRWRSNIGIATPSTNTAETQLTITVYDELGNAVYGPAPWTINQSSDVANGIRSFVQIPISTYVPNTYTGGLSVVISGVTGGPIIGYGTVIDGVSGDSVYLPMAKTQ